MFLDLNPNLTSEQLSLKEQTHKFAEEVMRPAADKLDKLSDPAEVVAKDSVLWDVLQQGHELGYHSRALPEELGGLGLGPVEQCIIAEEMGWGSAGLAVCMGASSMPFVFAALLGTPGLIEQHVIPFRDDRLGEFIGCWAITEPEHGGGDQVYIGSKREEIPLIRHQTRAKLDGDEWVINGQKSAWVSNGTIATKVQNTESAFAVASDAVQLPGGCGLSKEYPVERIFRAALIEDGDNDTLRLAGAGFLLERYT